MAETEEGKAQDQAIRSPEGSPATGQVTLSTIGDISVAAAEKSGKVQAGGRVRLRWTVLFFLVLYVATAWLGLHYMKAAPWVRIFMVPLLPVVVATFIFWWRQRTRECLQNSKFRLKIWQDALDGLGYAAANGVNAIRANLASFRTVNPHVSVPEHLNEVQEATDRIESVIRRSLEPITGKGPTAASRC